MTESNNQLRADLALAERELSERTAQRDDVRLQLVERDEQMVQIKSELVETNKQHRQATTTLSISNALLDSKDLELAERTAYLAAAALELSQRTAQLHQSHEYLLKKTEELERANLELKSMMQQREDYVAALTHDLKNPLVASIKVMELLSDGHIPQSQHEEVFQKLLESNRNMLRMIANLLKVYRYDSGSLVVEHEMVDVISLLNQCLEEYSYPIKSKQIELCLALPQDLPLVRTDKALLYRVLNNLLDNGVKFTPEKGKLSIGAGFTERCLSVNVKNSGVGMSEEQMGKLFGRFWQTKQGRAHGIGNGLGLFICKQIMEVLGGDITCTSTAHGGTQFTITLPAVE